MNALDGILLVDKREGESSYDVIRRLKSALGRGNTVKVGHAGTLDPFASGLLIVMLGQGTKLSRFLMSGTKRYLATVGLGIETDTLDVTGTVIKVTQVPERGRLDEAIERVTRGFVGEIEQVPPLFSAVKVGGKRAYQLARRGESIRLESRRVTVYSIEVTSVRLPALTIEVACSGGTYIRTLAKDIGKALGTGGHLKSLRRLASGPFRVEEAVSSAVLTREWVEAELQDRLIQPCDALPDLTAVRVSEAVAGKVRQGQSPLAGELDLGTGCTPCNPGLFKMVHEGRLVAIARLEDFATNDVPCRVTMERVFV